MMQARGLWLAVAACLASLASAAPEPPPLLIHWPMEPGAAGRLADAGELRIHLTARNAAPVLGKVGQAVHLQPGAEVRTGRAGLLDRAGQALTITAWIRVEAYPQGGPVALLAKRAINVATPFSLLLRENGGLGFEGFDGLGWISCWAGGGEGSQVPLRTWSHVAVTCLASEQVTLYIDGRPIGSRPLERALAANDQPVVLGSDAFRPLFTGDLDEVRIYAAALSAEQLAQDMAGTLDSRPATATDFPEPTHPATFTLVRYDAPLGFRDGYGRTRLEARRVTGPDAVDWPRFTLNGAPLWADGAVAKVDLKLRDGGAARPLFEQAGDDRVQPGGHWLRAVQWLWGQRYVYTTDPAARSWHNDYELWTFPVVIRGRGAVQDVQLRWDGQVIYDQPGPWNSLTLLLPQTPADQPFELTVDGRAPVQLHVGLKPITIGSPRAEVLPVELVLPGDGAPIDVLNGEPPFTHQQAWDEDAAAMASSPPRPGRIAFERRRPAIAIQAMHLTHGMSGGAFFSASDHLKKFDGSVEQWAAYLAETGYDRVFERTDDPPLIAALAARGVEFGLIPDTIWGRPFLSHPNVAFFSATLPDWHQPLYRDLQLRAQALGRFGNFAGFTIGADNGGYVSFWDWAPPIPNRPWGEAFLAFNRGDPTVPAPRHLGGQATVKEFLDYVARYDATFEQYGYFAKAVAEVDPQLAATTGSFGSSPGVGGRGGWPWATVPGQAMFRGMPVQQAYDWNELPSSKPMHLAALIDRLRSYEPLKPTWAVVDDFKLFLGREARQRAYALALTRGIEAIGTTFLAAPTGPEANPQLVKDQQELYAWVHRFGGVYRGTEPEASIGVMYVHPQAVLRRVVQDFNAPDEQQLRGSHEGKTTEALWLCHAAGWPAKIVTPEELRRGLPAGIKALLLVGLNRFDDSWVWYDGLEPEFQAFVAAGGRLLLDDESVVPNGLAATSTGLVVRAYFPQSETDLTPLLLARNGENLVRLRAAMAGGEPPVAVSEDPSIWAVPHRTGDVLYVTVVNWGIVEGQNASRQVKPQVGSLTWHTDRPIYDLRLGRRVTTEEASRVDLTRDGFQLYALPPRAVESVAEFERWEAPEPAAPQSLPVQQFLARKTIPVTIALTESQARDAALSTVVERLTAALRAAGRSATTATIAPGGLVLGLQPVRSTQAYPRWQTIPTDLVLLGTPRDNLLLFDQMRAGLLPAGGDGLVVNYSPFVGEYQALDVLGDDAAGLAKLVEQVGQAQP